MFKKLMKIALACGMAVTMTACSPSDDQPQGGGEETKVVTLKVWGSQEDQAMLGEMIDAFEAAHPETTWEISLGVVGEPDAKTKYLEDPAAAADVFAFANDQLTDLVNAGALYEVTRNKDAIIAANGEGSIGAATKDGKLYAYPFSADNGYFLYYDASVFTEEDVLSLDKMLEVANAGGKKVFMDVSNGWYIASFFIGAGCSFSVTAEGKQEVDFDTEAGYAAAEAVKSFTADTAFLTGDDNILKAGFADGSIAAGVSGTWNAADISSILGDNYRATKLPSYTDVNTGELVQMGSFAGYKLMGVNSQTEFPLEAMELAEWLTNEENQLIRFQKREIGPSNTTVAASEEVKANVALAALAAQSMYAVSQNDVLGTYWTPAEALGTTLEAKDYTKTIQELVDEMCAQIRA